MCDKKHVIMHLHKHLYNYLQKMHLYIHTIIYMLKVGNGKGEVLYFLNILPITPTI